LAILALEMLSEYPETDPLFIGAERLGRLCGRSGRWVRQREAERVIERASLNGQSPRRPIYEADEALPRLVGYLTARRQPSPEQLALAKERVAAARLHVEQRRLELGRLRGELVSVERMVAEWTPKCLAIRHALECLLERGVSQAIVDEVLSILGPVGESSSNGDAPGER
jgi:hypothetical protein